MNSLKPWLLEKKISMYGSFEMLLGCKVKTKKDDLRGRSYIMDYSPPKLLNLERKSIMFYLHGGGVNDIKGDLLKNHSIPVRKVALSIQKDSYYNNLHNFHQTWNMTFKVFFPCWLYRERERIVLVPPWYSIGKNFKFPWRKDKNHFKGIWIQVGQKFKMQNPYPEVLNTLTCLEKSERIFF